MKVYKGTVASEGLTIGRIVRLEHSGIFLNRVIQSPDKERALFKAAVALARQELCSLKKKANGKEKDIFTFQEMLLEDDDLMDEIDSYIKAGHGSAVAVEHACKTYAEMLSEQDDSYMQARNVDVRDACQRVVDILDGRPRTRLVPSEPVILASEEFFPSDIVGLGKGMILGLIAAGGSTQSHAAIIARGLGIPGVLGVGHDILEECDGKMAVLDAENGLVQLDPTPAVESRARRRMDELADKQYRDRKKMSARCCTRDGTEIELSANALGSISVEQAVRAGVRSIGLLRTEFLLDLAGTPDEETQYNIYRSCMAEARGREITIRVFDLGSDKGTTAARYTIAPNPGMGMRGMRIGVLRPKLFEDQLCALLRVSVGGNMRIAFPMVTCIEDWQFCMARLEAAKEKLRRRGTEFDEYVRVGCVVDTPAAALCAEELALSGPDFMLVSVSDLTQYTYGADRMNIQVQPFYRPQGRAIMRLMRMAIESANRHGLPVSLCGIGMSDPDLCEWYVRLGARRLILATRAIPDVYDRLTRIDLRE